MKTFRKIINFMVFTIHRQKKKYYKINLIHIFIQNSIYIFIIFFKNPSNHFENEIYIIIYTQFLLAL